MRTSTTSWLSTKGAQEALLDELVKIGETATPPAEKLTNKQRVLRALGTAGAGALGVGGGLLAGHFITKHPIFHPTAAEHAAGVLTPGRALAVKAILPILGGAAFMLADRYRKKMDEGLGAGQGT